MRVTNHFATRQAIATLAQSRERVNEAMAVATTGRRVRVASDDPTAARIIMQNESDQRAIDQRQRTIDAATARLTAQESAFDQITALLTRAKELAVAQASDTATPATRQAVMAEANQLLAQAVQIANTTHERGYLFGGRTPGTPPFTLDQTGAAFTFSVATPRPEGPLVVDVGSGQSMATSHDGVVAFGDENGGVLDAFAQLSFALSQGDGTAIANTITSIDRAIETTQTLTAETGAWMNRLESITQAGRDTSASLTSSTTALRDADMESALTELVARQTVFEAAMAATARTFGLSLTDYLR